MSHTYHHNSKSFGHRLRHFRESKKLTQSTLAEKAGLTASWISHFETGNRSPGIENLIRLAWGLGISLDRLCGTEPLDVMLKRAKQKPLLDDEPDNDSGGYKI